jgi:protein involved in polysaccharide export with SLBB domain
MFAVKRGGWVLVALSAGVVLASCAGPQVARDNAVSYITREPAPREAPRDYVLGPGDTIKVEFYYNEKLNRQLVIRPDGRITLPLKGEVDASRLTPDQLSRRIRELFSDVLKEPVVTVTVETTGKSNVVYVMGEVQKPDYYTLESPTTVTQILARAGVNTTTANLSTVLVIRRDSQGKPVGRLVNVNDILNKADLGQDIVLGRYDIVYVSRSMIAKADLFVDQYINRLVPNLFRLNYNFTNVLDNGNND